MKEKPQYNCELCDVHSNCAEHTSEPEEWSEKLHYLGAYNLVDNDEQIDSIIRYEIRKAEENAKTNLLREMKQMADKEVKISMVAGEIIQVRQLEVIQTVAKLHNIRL
jgi:hypothetical protein